MSERERHLVGLLRRLLRLCERYRAENVRLRRVIDQLVDERQKADANHAAEMDTADLFCGAAMDELLARQGHQG